MFYILKTIIIELLYLGMERTRHSIFQLAKFCMSMKSARLHSRQGFSVMRNTVCCFLRCLSHFMRAKNTE